MWPPPCCAHYRTAALEPQEGVHRPKLGWVLVNGSPFLELMHQYG